MEQFDQMIAVNLRGPFLVAKAVWPVMKPPGSRPDRQRRLDRGLRAWAGASAYHASKFGLLGIEPRIRSRRTARRDPGHAVIPGGMRTNFFDRFADQGIPIPDPYGLQDPAQVAEAIVLSSRRLAHPSSKSSSSPRPTSRAGHSRLRSTAHVHPRHQRRLPRFRRRPRARRRGRSRRPRKSASPTSSTASGRSHSRPRSCRSTRSTTA